MPQQESLKRIRLFVSSPGDVEHERRRVSRVVERLDGEFAPLVTFDVVRWEARHYSAHANPQTQIPEAAECHVVIAIFAARLGTELPREFPRKMPSGQPYPSGSAYEVLTAIEARRAGLFPDVYVFRKNVKPVGALDDDDAYRQAKQNWERLNGFFQSFVDPQGRTLGLTYAFATTDEFAEHVHTLLREWLGKHVLHGEDRALWPIKLRGSPFRGLKPFDARHAPVFFGRSRDVDLAIRRLVAASERGARCLFVVGASGVGKSSFVHAGVAPRLTTPGVVERVDLWRTASMRPGRNPVEALARSLMETTAGRDPEDDEAPLSPALPEIADGDFKTASALAALMETGTQALASPILNALRRIAARERDDTGSDREIECHLLIVVDQLDDLFITGADAARELFAKLLVALIATGHVWIITTLRVDLYERYLADANLRALKQGGVDYDLGPPDPADIGEIIRRPATAAGLEFERSPEGDKLDSRLLRDAADSAEILPLLEYTLQRLFDAYEERDGLPYLTFKVYDSLGGLSGAIDRAGEDALKTLTAGDAKALPNLLRRLVVQVRSSRPGQPQWTLQSIPLRDLPKDSAIDRLANALRDARLLTTTNEGNIASVRLAHQRVIESWKTAGRILHDNADFFRISGAVRQQHQSWQAGGGLDSLLVPGDLLSEARGIVRRFRSELDAEFRTFITVSEWKQRLFRLPLQMLALIALVLVVYLAADGAGYLLDYLDGNPNEYYRNMVETYGNLLIQAILMLAACITWPLLTMLFFWRYITNRNVLSRQYLSHIADAKAHGADFAAASRWRSRSVVLNICMLFLLLVDLTLAGFLAVWGGRASIYPDAADMGYYNYISEISYQYSGVLGALVVVLWPACGLLLSRQHKRRARSFAQQEQRHGNEPSRAPA